MPAARTVLCARLLTAAGSALIVGGFFLPWFDGTAEFAARDFSGLDLARLVRNFEVIASSSGEAGRLRATAVILYGGPALAVNAAVFAIVPPLARWSAHTAALASIYTGVILTASAMLAALSLSDLERVLGGALSGYYASLVGVLALATAGAMVAGGALGDEDELAGATQERPPSPS